MNEYENAALLNPNEARQINEAAGRLVERARPILEEVERRPAMANMHHPQTGGRWRDHYVSDAVNRLFEMYGVVCPGSLKRCQASQKTYYLLSIGQKDVCAE